MEFTNNTTTITSQEFVHKLVSLLTTTLFKLGDIKISFSFVINLVIQTLIVVLIARVVKEITKNRILNRFGLDIGTREALSSLVNYLIITIGCLIVLQNVGISFETLAVVLGAIGCVLAFGLQPLTSDLASGVTLLLEQPIKIGDYVEIEEVAGVVENVGIRSTIVRNAQCKAVVVPNARITATNVTNWSYQTAESCTEIALRIPRGYDPLAIVEVLSTVVRKEPRVLPSPAPKVHLKGIDDDFLNFEIWVWINQPLEVDAIKSALYFLVEAELQKQGLIQPCDRPASQLQPNRALAIESTDFNSYSLRELLLKVSYFASLDDIALRHIIEEGYRKTLAANEVICRENDLGDSFYIILSGSVDVYVDSIDKHIAVREAGEFIGEMSLLMGTPRTATLKTLEETTLFVVDRGNLQSLLQKQQGLADRLSEELAKRQESLEKLGIKLDSGDKESPLVQIRKRIQSLFGI
jgi:potassium-dependent mechanosensitive channel